MYDEVSLSLGIEAKQFDTNDILDEVLKRKLEMISQIGTSILEEEDLDRFNHLTNEMSKIYSTAKVPDFNDESKFVSLEPELTERLAESRDPKELEYYWTYWRKVTGKEIKEMYKEYVNLTNKAARLNGFRDGTEMKTHAYESKTFVEEMAATWNGLKVLQLFLNILYFFLLFL